MSPLPRRFLFLVLGCLLAAGCGDGDADKTAPFVGTWTVAAGSQLMATCNPPPPPPLPGSFMEPLQGAEQTILKGTESDLLLTLLEGCTVKVDVAGKIGTIRPGQSCTITFRNFPVMGMITSGTFSLTDTGAAFSYAGTGGLGSIMCPFTASGTSVKSAANDAGAAGDAGAAADAGAPG